METSVPLCVRRILTDAPQRRPAAAYRQFQEAEQHLGDDERVAACDVAVVRNHVEHLAQCIERELTYRRARGAVSDRYETSDEHSDGEGR